MMWCSPSSPTRCSTSCWRTEALDDLRARGLRGLIIATAATITAALALVFFYAPLDANQGFVQKIFYIHVPLAIVSLVRLRVRRRARRSATCDRRSRVGHALLRRDPHVADLRDRRADHRLDLGQGVVGPLVGVEEPTLVSFLIVMLLFATYQPLRFSIEDPERQARYASVFAVVAGAFVPMNFIAVRLAAGVRPPARADARRAATCPGSMRLTFLVSLLGIALLFVTLWKYEMAAKDDAHADRARCAAHAARRGRGRARCGGALRRHDRSVRRRPGAAAAHRRPVRRRRLHRVRGDPADLRGDHGHAAVADRARAGASCAREVEAQRGRARATRDRRSGAEPVA